MDKQGMAVENDLTAVKRITIYQEIADQIQKLFDQGRLRRGDQLPPERRLAEIFKTSRHSVREAIRTLEQKGLIQSRVGLGTYVVNDNHSLVVDYLSRALIEDRYALPEIFQFRHMIEPKIAALAADKAGQDDIRLLGDLLRRQQEASDDIEVFIDLDQSFHLGLAKAAHNGILLKVVERLNDILMRSRVALSQDENRLRFALEAHTKIFSAVKLGDPTRAALAMEEHLVSVAQLALAGLAVES